MVEAEMDEKVMLLSREKNLANLKEEGANLLTYLEGLRRQRDIFIEQGDLDTQSWEIAKKHFIVLKPTWEYETIPEYMALVLRAKENDYQLRKIQFVQQLKQLETNIASVEEQVKSLNLDAERIEKEMNIYGTGKNE